MRLKKYNNENLRLKKYNNESVKNKIQKTD